jgi:hypothetical protein
MSSNELTPAARKLLQSNPEAGAEILAMDGKVTLKFRDDIPMDVAGKVRGQNVVWMNTAHYEAMKADLEADPNPDITLVAPE